MNTQEKENKYYTDNQAELVKKFNNKFLVIKDAVIDGVFDTDVEAYKYATSKYELGTFIIKHCLPTKQTTAQYFRTRVLVG